MEKLEPLAQETPHPFRQVKVVLALLALLLVLIMVQVVVVVQGVLAQRELVRLVAMAEAPQRHLFQDHQLITQEAVVAALMLAVA